jgi:hypothetical protein
MRHILTIWFVVALAGGIAAPRGDQATTSTLIKTRDALARSESWMDHRAYLISARTTEAQETAEIVAVKIVDYQSPLGIFNLAVVPVKQAGHTYLMDGRRLSLEGRETFYIRQANDLLMCAVGSGFVYVVPSFARTRTLQGGLPAAIAHFAQTVDDAELRRVASMELTVNLQDTMRGSSDMWVQSPGSAHGANPIILARSVVDSVLRLDLQSPSGGMRRSVWIDLKEGKLLRYAPDGKGSE